MGMGNLPSHMEEGVNVSPDCFVLGLAINFCYCALPFLYALISCNYIICVVLAETIQKCDNSPQYMTIKMAAAAIV